MSRRRRTLGDEIRTRLVTDPVTATDAAEAAVRAPLATLLTGQVVHHGEIIQFIIKPSRWHMLLNSLLFSAAVTILVFGLNLVQADPVFNKATSTQIVVLLIVGRVVWSALQWMGRYYILTDMRAIRVSGVLSVNIYACPLRKISAARLYASVSERLLGKGSIEITSDSDCPLMFWQTISQPTEIHEALVAAITRAKQNGCNPA